MGGSGGWKGRGFAGGEGGREGLLSVLSLPT